MQEAPIAYIIPFFLLNIIAQIAIPEKSLGNGLLYGAGLSVGRFFLIPYIISFIVFIYKYIVTFLSFIIHFIHQSKLNGFGIFFRKKILKAIRLKDIFRYAPHFLFLLAIKLVSFVISLIIITIYILFLIELFFEFIPKEEHYLSLMLAFSPSIGLLFIFQIHHFFYKKINNVFLGEQNAV